ncbi:MAG: FAD-binding oxidoreductase, partial [Alphaproteobacteria bacterium]
MVTARILEKLEACVGPGGFTTEAEILAPLLIEGRGKFVGQAAALLRPANTQEVSAILKICNATGTPIVPQGGNTGNVGGQTPDSSGSSILLSLVRMKQTRSIDPGNNTLVVDAGVTLIEAQQIAAQQIRLFPLSLASEGTCTIGGNLATNAGGNAVLRFGNMRDLTLGLEVVLPNGEILNDLSGLRKNNTGYDLKQLFIGSEGTLGVITAACLKLFPQPAETATAMIAVKHVEDALPLLDSLQTATGNNVTSFEIMPRLAFDFLCKHYPQLRQPFSAAPPWALLVEASGTNMRAPFEKALAAANALDIV